MTETPPLSIPQADAAKIQIAALVDFVESHITPRPGMMTRNAPDGGLYDNIEARDSSPVAAISKLVQMIHYQVWRAKGAGQDTVWWRDKPDYHNDGTENGWIARCRIRFGKKWDEKPEHTPAEDPIKADGHVHHLYPPLPQELATTRDMPQQPELPRWKCHKVVQADKIVSVHYPDGSAGLARWRLAGGGMIMASRDLARRVADSHTIDSGYYVRYEGGYESWSPAKDFEAGYTRIEATQGENVYSLAWVAFEKVVQASFMERWPKDEHHARIRSICIGMALGEGYNDPERVTFALNGPLPPAAQGIDITQGQWVPTWATYYQKVRKVLDHDPAVAK